MMYNISIQKGGAKMNKRLFSLFMALLLLVSCLPAGFAAAAEPPAKEYGVYIPGSHIAYGSATVTVMLTGGKRDAKDPEAWKKEIRVFGYDPETGLFETGEGREPGEETRWTGWLENGNAYTVQLTKPGKYRLSGVLFYVLDPANGQHTALLDELDEALWKADAKTRKTKGTNLYKWLQKRVKSKLPADRPELAEICVDPLNALLTGFAAQAAYPPLLQLVMSATGIRTVLVDGKLLSKDGETDWVWVLCELDEKWLWADPALDAGKTAYFAKEDAAMTRDHQLSAEAEDFIRGYIGSNYMDILLRQDAELESRMMISNRNEGWLHSLVFIEGPLYSVGPSEPVTLRIYRNYEETSADGWDDAGMRDFILNNVLMERQIWDKTTHFFKRPLQSDPLFREVAIKKKDVEILEYSPDLTRIVIRFIKPGLYKFWSGGDTFCVLDPEDPEQAEIGRMLDEARDTLKGETDRETAKNLQDWIAQKLKYDYNAFRVIRQMYADEENLAGSVWTEENDDTAQASQDPFGALSTGLSVCGGYSNLYTLLLKNVGIPAFQIVGKPRKLSHAWNLLRLDGQWLYADPTWDDNGKTSGTKYFCGTYDQFTKHHGEFAAPESYVKDLFETPIYHLLCHRFDTRYAVKLDIPEEFRALPGDVSAYPFPAKTPPFIDVKWQVKDNEMSFKTGARTATAYAVRNMAGNSSEAYCADMFMRDAERPPIYRYIKGSIVEIQIQDYTGSLPPGKKPSICQEYYWGRTVLEETKLSYTVPMKRNEIRGYSDKSSRTWIYDADLNRKGMAWNLEKDGTVLTVTAHFDGNGKTERVSVLLTPPSGGNGIGWTTTKDGHVTSLRLDDGNDTYLLEEMNDTWMQNRFEVYRKNLLKKYPSLSEDEPLPEGVHLYRFSKDALVTEVETLYLFRPNLYTGEPIATMDELLIWDGEGRLQVNPDARDLKGRPINIRMGKDMDLSMATRLQITE